MYREQWDKMLRQCFWSKLEIKLKMLTFNFATNMNYIFFWFEVLQLHIDGNVKMTELSV